MKQFPISSLSEICCLKSKDKVLVAVGRKSNIGEDIIKLGIKLNNQKKIQVNEKFETSIKNIFAIDFVEFGDDEQHITTTCVASLIREILFKWCMEYV